MKKAVLTFIGLFTIILSCLFISQNEGFKVFAEAQCPAGMTLLECYEYYKNQEANLQNQEKNLTKKLKDEEYQQLSLNEKIKYIQQLISQNESLIKSLQIEISANDLSIRILEEEINKKEDNISLLKQEINALSSSVNQRITESYKYSFINQLELFLDLKNFSSILRKSKYLATTRSMDKIALEQYTKTVSDLAREEGLLLEDKDEIELKKLALEEERKEYELAKTELDGQKVEQANLLAQSKRREALYSAELKQVMSSLSESEKATADLYSRMEQAGLFKSGRNVAKGEIIGLQGHTGCSFGSHLHYQLRRGTAIINPSGYLNGTEYGQYVTNGIYQTPLNSGLVTNDYWGGHGALDMVSRTDGNQSWERYTVPYGLCPIVDNILTTRKNAGLTDWNLAYLNGEGATVRASTTGSVTYCYDNFGATWASLKHSSDGNTSWYVHLQPVALTSYDCVCSKTLNRCR